MILKEELRHRLSDASRIALLGIGSVLRADDAAGVLVAESLLKGLRRNTACRRIEVFIGATAPENLTGALKDFQPSHLVIVDAADIGKKPGSIVLLTSEELRGTSFCTHQLPLHIMVDYLAQSFPCEVITVGIQPKTLAFGKPVSLPVKKAVRTICQAMRAALA